MTTMTALRLTDWQREATLQDVSADVTTFPLEEAPAADAGPAAGEIVGRPVIVPFARYSPDR
ncbi:hypothetical protein KRR39_07905 [Nocardioides panacis]|uniref:Uncharacterized protein n=1 Tax=Nocardioides panacis TaxID=2849501 RepID=A0A975Y1M1_9ACTN|nr:hypothetical protein [Nocardioides panacis]QWZ09653.1 hypothetical protein KRR39_07905 [Nocardioides panacis]